MKSVDHDLINYLGPNFIGVLFQAVQTGYIISQAFRFWGMTSARNEKLVVRLSVAFCTIVSIAQTAINFTGEWIALIENFGNPVRSRDYM